MEPVRPHLCGYRVRMAGEDPEDVAPGRDEGKIVELRLDYGSHAEQLRCAIRLVDTEMDVVARPLHEDVRTGGNVHHERVDIAIEGDRALQRIAQRDAIRGGNRFVGFLLHSGLCGRPRWEQEGEHQEEGGFHTVWNPRVACRMW